MALTTPLPEIPAGSAAPRLSPPRPIKTQAAEYDAVAKQAGINLWPWQQTAAAYLMAREADHWRYREVCIVVGRQNGKTELLIPRILWGLAQGRRMLHTAQNRSLPRQVFIRAAQVVDPNTVKVIRYANGQEEILAKNGGSYQIIAPQRSARGLSADDLFVDELREFEDFDFIGAATPTLTASSDPQIIYLSNAGHDDSVVLNQLREGTDDRLAYLEWSADPELDAGDIKGWAQANPALGYLPRMYDNLQHAYVNRPSALFETEHLCRWVASLSLGLVTDIAWRGCMVETLTQPFRPYLGVALDPAGKRASAALAWKSDDGTVSYRPLLEVTDPAAIDVDDFGAQVRAEALRYRVRGSAYSAVSDTALARYLTKPTTVDGRLFANASANFATLVENRRLRWSEDGVSDDLRYTIRKEHAEGAWSAVRSEDSRPITAVLAAVRAVWLASAPKPPVPRIG